MIKNFPGCKKAPFAVAGILFLILRGAAVFADTFTFDPVRPEIESGKFAGFGGAYSTLEAGFDTLSTNPAALAYVNREWSVARIAVKASGPLFDLPAVFQSSDVASGVIDLVAANKGVYFGANMTGPLAFGKVDKNFGFGIFNRTISSVNVSSLVKGTVMAGEELLMVGGYGMTIFEKGPNSIAVGLQLKGYFQTFMYDSGTAISVIQSVTQLSADGIPAVFSTGFGLDVGALYKLDDQFSAAITCKDLFTPVFSTRYASFSSYLENTPNSSTVFTKLDPNLTAGVAYSLPIPDSWTTVSSLKFMFDYRDALSVFKAVYRNPILNCALGSELVLLKTVSLRAGINESYLSAGLGLDLTIFDIDFAMYGSELGLDPGSRPLLNMALSVAFEY
jgi:hypothetical protein